MYEMLQSYVTYVVHAEEEESNETSQTLHFLVEGP